MGERSEKASKSEWSAPPVAAEEAGWPAQGWGWGQDVGGKGRGWGARPPGAARARVPSWDMRLGINIVCFIISLRQLWGQPLPEGEEGQPGFPYDALQPD